MQLHFPSLPYSTNFRDDSDEYCSPSSSRDTVVSPTVELTDFDNIVAFNNFSRYFPYSRRSLLVVLIMVSVCTGMSPPPLPIPTRPPIPTKLLQGCPNLLLLSRFFGHIRVQCRTNPSTAISAYEGMKDAMNECSNRMRFLPWDCSQTEDIMHDPLLLKYGYKESALVWALSSAGAAWGVATACAQGWLSDCECAKEFEEATKNWQWGGCSAGVQHGIATSRKMLTRTSGGPNSALRKLEKHNLKAGRLAVKKTLISLCKCHGVSGSCQQKTCWKQPASMTTITKHLIDKYHKAKVMVDDGKLRNNDLLFIEASPDHCAIKGDKSRVCGWRNETHAQGDCGRLCCGRGFNITHQVNRYKCDCKFVWCCQLQCNECMQHRWVSTCT
ncbi:hypothetical protein PFISCL1PPCAC_19708 [Pristionchus fissidentatus]|uniref:Protein Wnt n=1 Tax=Pristionchus fissidentatus TaxID=1538716 RepID=A0AAV5W865_9BILA|nr:hypothetical protein PFISCL1PPCAC_19708 [Pristionchus fissidentatus]